MFSKILIANRGEIACRVVRTARRMGVKTVAVYSDADAMSMHVAMADEAVHIGPAPAAESYLVAAKVIEAAKSTGAEAIHPGYGFLSENEKFARALDKAGIAFIGPPVKAIRAMGSKSEAKKIMEKAGVPLVPGYHGDKQDLTTLKSEAKKIGYPVLIKASAGGGGKGMRIVESEKDFKDALDSAKREASSSFGDDHVLVEKYLTKPRHIEIQVFADQKGRTVYLFERECSIQRRHQKVIEEAPAPKMKPARRAEMGEAAVRAAEAIGYVGAGTVEFIAEGDDFFFMEMNTRLQVEHPVTEYITGQDLVEWQLRVASGEPLPKQQDELEINGHAIEARIYAEDPARDFMPATGHLQHLRFPEATASVRIDTGVRQGDTVSIHYDPMIAKLIVWGPDRETARGRMAAALASCQAVGVTTNIGFLLAIVEHPAFAKGNLDTGFIPRHEKKLLADQGPSDDRTLALAALHVLTERARDVAKRAANSNDPFSPWNQSSGWRLNDDGLTRLRFDLGGQDTTVTAHNRGGRYLLDLPGGSVMASAVPGPDGALRVSLDGYQMTAAVVRTGMNITVIADGRTRALSLFDPILAADDKASGGNMGAPMPGKVVAIKVKKGARVAAGDALMILEAMKMEHTITAPAAGTVAELNYAEGDQVEEGAELLVFEAEG